jgi:hypothetical protein
MKNTEKRPIESFELSANYYLETFLNGNKTHAAEELSDLMLVNFSIFTKILIDLPKEIQSFVLNSEAYRKADLKMTLDLARVPNFRKHL